MSSARLRPVASLLCATLALTGARVAVAADPAPAPAPAPQTQLVLLEASPRPSEAEDARMLKGIGIPLVTLGLLSTVAATALGPFAVAERTGQCEIDCAGPRGATPLTRAFGATVGMSVGLLAIGIPMWAIGGKRGKRLAQRLAIDAKGVGPRF